MPAILLLIFAIILANLGCNLHLALRCLCITALLYYSCCTIMRFGLACIMLGYRVVCCMCTSSQRLQSVSKGIEAPIGIQWIRIPHKGSSYIHQLYMLAFQTIKGGVCTHLGMAGVGWDWLITLTMCKFQFEDNVTANNALALPCCSQVFIATTAFSNKNCVHGWRKKPVTVINTDLSLAGCYKAYIHK